MRLLDHLVQAIRGAAVFNPEVEVGPVCILWPDHARQWADVIPTLQGAIPELLVLGDYAPDRRTGPAIWLRCVLARSWTGCGHHARPLHAAVLAPLKHFYCTVTALMLPCENDDIGAGLE